MHTTIPIASRVSVQSFATLVRAYEKEGVHLRSKSDVLWRAVEQLSIMYCRKHEIEPIASVREAMDYMEMIGLPLATNSRSVTALVQAEADEAYLVESGECIGARTTKGSMKGYAPIVTRSIHDMSKEELEAAARRIAGQMIQDGTLQVDAAVSDDSQPVDVAAFQQKEAGKLADIKAALAMRPDSVEAEDQASEVS